MPYNTNVCYKCKMGKDLSEFHKCKKNGRQSTCKSCKKELCSTPENRAKDKLRRDRTKEKSRDYNIKYRVEKKETLKTKGNQYYQNNKEHIAVRNGVWRSKPANQEKIRIARNKRRQERFATEPLFKLQYNLRHRIKEIFKAKRVVNRPATEAILGCKFTEAKVHLEMQFKEGMSWENHGFGKGFWHIDHRIPLDSAKTKEELIKLCHHTNLQPLWSEQNIAKRAKMPEEWEAVA